MSELERQIKAWLEELAQGDSIHGGAQRELESHLRTAIDCRIEDGATQQEAFDLAVIDVGDAARLEPEFRKLCPEFSWARRFIWMISGYALVELVLRLSFIAAFFAMSLALRWFPDVTIGLPWTMEIPRIPSTLETEGPLRVEGVHIAILVNCLLPVIGCGIVLAFAHRLVRRRRRFFEVATRSPYFALGACAILIVSSLVLEPALMRLYRGTIDDAFSEPTKSAFLALIAFLSSLSFFEGWLSLALFVVVALFSTWALGLLRRPGTPRYAIHLFVGYFLVTGIIHLAGIGGAIVALVGSNLSPEFASGGDLDLGQEGFYFFFHSNPGAISLLVQILLCAIILSVGIRVILTGRAARIERSLPGLWRHRYPLLFLWFVPPLWNLLSFRLFNSHSIYDRMDPAWSGLMNSALFNSPTNGMINAGLLSKCKPDALLINASRGALVNESDLAEALTKGTLGGAALDVVANEPIGLDNPLLAAPNCIITPHMAWSSLQARQRLMQSTADNITAFISGTPQNVVST